METFKKKSLVLKIVIALVVVILFNFSAPTISRASIGGTLLGPVVDLGVALGDGLMFLIQSILFGLNYSTIKLTDNPPGNIIESLLQFGAGILDFGANIFGDITGIEVLSNITEGWVPNEFYLPVYVISPEEIFQNKIGVLDVNFFNPNPYDSIQTVDGGETKEQTSTAAALQATISSWYLTLRNLAMVVLLIVLLYIGIRIVTSSASQERAKYKEKLFSWIIAMCLLIFMHYIMSMAVTVVEAFSEGINELNSSINIGLTDLSEYYIEQKDKEGENAYAPADQFFSENDLIQGGNYVWPTNLLGTVRIQMQLEPPELSEDNVTLRKAGYTVLYLMIVFYTAAFLVVYIKRTIMLAFLTMIAPLVAMTYPLDKMNDGNAQAFNMWLKEYIFNLLIQPFHLILYTMLVGSAIQFATENLIYSIVAIGFIFQAEKLLRKFFGFNKAETIDSNGSTLAGMAGMAGINLLRRVIGGGKRGGKSGSGNGSDSGSSGNNGRVRQADRGRSLMDLLNARQGNSGQTGQQRQLTQGSNQSQNNNDDDNFDLPLHDPELEAREQALASYRSQGYGQNADGEYYNPYIDDYDKNYDPANDENYNERLHQQNLANARALEMYRSEGFGRNADGHYFNPATEEYDPNYDPTKDENYNDFLRQPEIHEPIRQRLNLDQPPTPEQVTQPTIPSTPEQRGNGNFTWSEDDTRGMGQWIAQGVGKKWNESKLKEDWQNSPVANLGRKLGEGAEGIRDKANNGIKKMPKPFRNTVRGVATLAGKAATYAVPRAGKLYAKAAIAGTAGLVGFAAGAATGDAWNAFKYGGAGVAAGWAAGSVGTGMASRAINAAGDFKENVASTYTKAVGGNKAEQARLNAKADAEAMKDKNRQKLFKEKLDLKNDAEVKKAMKEAQKYRESGITDDKVIIGAMKANNRDFGLDKANDERIILAGLAADVGNDQKKIKNMESRLRERGFTPEDVKKYVEGVREINKAW